MIRVIDSYKVPTFHIKYGDHMRPQLQGSHIPYKVWGTISIIDNYKVHELHIRYGGNMSLTVTGFLHSI